MKRRILNTVLGLAAWLAAPFSERAAAASNTTVRFHLTYGNRTFGDVDVELFDEEKPVTVSNFLSYVRSGAYLNTILHRASPDTGPVVLQGGGFTVPNPYSLETWTCSPLVPTNAPITNEFLVGPRRSNVNGTLAMAKLDNAPDSANSQWFFNLADNGFLDSNNGGFTVFGRVIRGEKVLNYFTTARNFDGLIQEIPVAYRRFAALPRSVDVFRVDISELPLADTRRPAVKITAPAAGPRFSGDMLCLTGTASDNHGVREVWYYPDDCQRAVADGTNHWSLTITNVPPGTNTIYVESVDAAGNRSPAVGRSYFRVVPVPIRLDVIGEGSIRGGTNGQVFEMGRNYVFTAVPAKQHMFAGWEARQNPDTNIPPISVANPRVAVLMNSNVSLTALFVTNPFAPLKASYTGLFVNTNDTLLLHETIGSVDVSVTDLGRYSGKLLTQGKTYRFSGAFPPVDGLATNQLSSPGQPVLEIVLSIDVTARTNSLSGYVWDRNTWASAVKAFRVERGTRAHPSPLAGSYTVLLPGGTNSPGTKPTGDGFGQVTVSSAGSLRFAGMLPDGTRVTQGSAASTNGMWPLYASLYAGQGSVLSWVTIDTNQVNDDLSAQLAWFRPPVNRSKLFTNGLAHFGALTGSRFVPPARGLRVLDLEAGIVTLAYGNLDIPLTNVVALGSNNVVVAQPGSHKLSLKLSASTGLFGGALTPPDSTRPLFFKGVVLQRQKFGAGYFLGTDQIGRVYFGP